MNNTLVFVRHAATKKDPDIHAIYWGLTETGEQEAIKLANNEILLDTDIILSSSELKAILTIEPLAKKLDIEIITIDALSEAIRGTKFLSKEDFDSIKKEKFLDLHNTQDGGESYFQSLSRFKQAITEINQKYQNKTIVIASHATVLALYFSDILNDLDNAYERWSKIKYCAIGIIKNGKVIKDIS